LRNFALHTLEPLLSQLREISEEERIILLLNTKDIIKGKIPMDTLPQPYLFLEDTNIDQLTEAMNLIALKKGYRVVSHSVMPHGTCNVCMMKE
jgi:hypothetical protein